MRPWLFALVPACALLLLEACDAVRQDPTAQAPDPPAAVADLDAGGGAEDPEAKAADEQRLVLPLAAASFVASVSDSPEWPESDGGARRLGYLRNGAVVAAYDPPIKNDECKDGWYELVGGGYVCGKVATIDLTNPRVRLAPKQPDRDAGTPYRYAANVADGTPVYRRVLSAEDRRKYEPRAAPRAEASAGDGGSAEGEDKSERGEEPALASAEEEAPPPRRGGRAGARERERSKDPFQSPDAGRPLLKDLKGRGVLVRRMARGFTVAIDRDFQAAGARWWRTTFGFAVPYERLVPIAPRTKLVGRWFTGEGAVAELLPLAGVPELDADAGDRSMSAAAMDAGAGDRSMGAAATDAGAGDRSVGAAAADAGAGDRSTDAAAADAGAAALAGTVAFVPRAGVHELAITEDAKGALKIGAGAELPKRSGVLLTGREAKVGGLTYHQTSGGFWVRLPELRVAKPEIPADVGPDEKWIDVDLTRQQLVAFEGRRPVFATLISSGRRNPQDPERDFPTPTGTFRIREKHVTATMDGDVASDGPYSIEDVPWVMYFQGSYALHGAFWHDAFGNVRSHGCVNMSPEDARTLFDWAEPRLPPGWHGVFSKDETSGSRVVVHEDPPPGKRRR